MKNYIQKNEWNIIEEDFDPHLNKISESIFSLGNGRMGQRANFEEHYSGETLQGNYVAGVYYPDKTRVGWWKNGYPEYFAKVLNAANWIGLDITIGDERLDLFTCKVINFKRILNMQSGYLERLFTAELKSGKQVQVNTKRFCSITSDEIGAIRYELIALNFSETIHINSFVDGDVKNQDSNYDEKFWEEVSSEITDDEAYLTLKTKKTGFDVCTGISTQILLNGENINSDFEPEKKEKFVGLRTSVNLNQGDALTIFKFATNVSSENYEREHLLKTANANITEAAAKGFETLLKEQSDAWVEKWKESDIVIEGDIAAQQAIRFNIFQLFQTYTGKDARLNIGPKGFTGEKYGGSTYWDTEAYCVPFYLATAPQEVTRNLLLYRYKQLDKAIENAEKLGFKNGAALYPMVTMNGEECHNEWEITFEEIHRNGAIAYAIFNYVRYTNDESYLKDYGLEVLIGIARFWSQRVNWSADKQKYVMLGVTGPNEYENNVNNNWYTNTIAAWCMQYALEVAELVKANDPQKFAEMAKIVSLDEAAEFELWQKIVDNMYYPEDENLGVFLQQDGYLDKEQILVSELPAADRPLNQKWSWDRILRSCFIKQADVLQGFYFFEDRFDDEILRRNFDFYEPRTVHESSLSPCVHAILAAKLGDEKRAYEFYLRTSRLDLDDYNNDTEDGLHITSMAGTWMSVVEGFAGMRVRNGVLHFNPFLPEKWNSFSFNISFRGAVLNVRVSKEKVRIINHSESDISVVISGKQHTIQSDLTVMP
ncbi:glycoside hydrolase family 65 protein [Pedobacter sp. HMF7647]|uniref:Glycoside hydrolase family 65 protein n=1 Tax=Hufsiella arboris TaxID=2695275 RepID=A0A7K1YA33_9SPHI|nr:glycoside hydrolase family 65 protein [Hufsiella arboris]MXV50979.1 glycoside hydrolase family 65 protein [Hufsiella arboris]